MIRLEKFKLQLKILFLLSFIMTLLLMTVCHLKNEDINLYQEKLHLIVSNSISSELESENVTVELPVDFPKISSLWRPIVTDNETEFDDRILKQRQWIEQVVETSFFQDLKPKKILVLDGFYSYFGHNGHLNCPSKMFEQKCKLAEDHWYTGFYRNFEEWDAVVTLRNWVYRIYESRLPTSRQIMFTVESPYVTLNANLSVNNAILASYWSGSDITIPYGKWVSYAQLGGDNFNSKQVNVTKGKNFAQGRNKLVAIVVSNCTPENRRLDYVNQLQTYIKVDIYGECGTLTCGSDCFNQLKKQYKFYLSFENANCIDYITEKFFYNALQHDMVPVTLGAHKKDYLKAAPPMSFIHVEDFASARDLASYLIYLDKNDEKYNSYFAWKNLGTFVDPLKDLFCRICGLLLYEDFVSAPVWPSGSTWKSVNKCLPKGKLYWDR